MAVCHHFTVTTAYEQSMPLMAFPSTSSMDQTLKNLPKKKFVSSFQLKQHLLLSSQMLIPTKVCTQCMLQCFIGIRKVSRYYSEKATCNNFLIKAHKAKDRIL